MTMRGEASTSPRISRWMMMMAFAGSDPLGDSQLSMVLLGVFTCSASQKRSFPMALSHFFISSLVGVIRSYYVISVKSQGE